MIQSDEIAVPVEFQVALYENLVQLQKRGFQHVYRDGDRNAAGVADLVVLHSTVRRFKPGSEMARQVTTVAGTTSISIHCQFTTADGQPLLEQDVTGKVRFLAGISERRSPKIGLGTAVRAFREGIRQNKRCRKRLLHYGSPHAK
jgi:hypothetical protein